MPFDFDIAVVATVCFPISHADVIVSRWLEPRATDIEWGWSGPQTRIASMYVAQFPSNDIARALAARHGVPLYPSVEEALTRGGEKLAVDGVLLIGEHGDYPRNEWGQKLFPRKELFDRIVAVFRTSGRSVPVFCDKHLSWNPEWAREMVATARELGFPLMAGSSLPWCGVEPDLGLQPGFDLEECVALFYGGVEVYGFHSLELAQSLLERRANGEAGVQAMRVDIGEQAWAALERGEWSQDLFQAALAAARRVRPGDPRANCRPNPEPPPVPGPVALRLRHADGLRSTHVMLHGHLDDFTLALRLQGEQGARAGCSRITHGGPPNHYGHFATLDRAIEEMFLSGRAPAPIERTLLTSCITAASMRALQTPGEWIETPELMISYQLATVGG